MDKIGTLCFPRANLAMQDDQLTPSILALTRVPPRRMSKPKNVRIAAGERRLVGRAIIWTRTWLQLKVCCEMCTLMRSLLLVPITSSTVSKRQEASSLPSKSSHDLSNGDRQDI